MTLACKILSYSFFFLTNNLQITTKIKCKQRLYLFTGSYWNPLKTQHLLLFFLKKTPLKSVKSKNCHATAIKRCASDKSEQRRRRRGHPILQAGVTMQYSEAAACFQQSSYELGAFAEEGQNGCLSMWDRVTEKRGLAAAEPGAVLGDLNMK